MADRLQEELDALAVRLGRSLTVDGLDGELLAHSTQWDDADQARIASILLRHVSPERREWEERHVGPDPSGPVAVPANAELGMSARLCVPLRRADRTIGFLWMLNSVRIPAGTPNGRTFRVRGKGVRRTDGTNGDLLVTVSVQVPQKLTGPAREALNSFRDATAGEDPREELLQRAKQA